MKNIIKNIKEKYPLIKIISGIILRLLLIIVAVLWALFFIPVGILSILIYLISGESIIEHYMYLYLNYIDID